MNNEMILIVLLCVCAGLAVELTGLRAWRMLALNAVKVDARLLRFAQAVGDDLRPLQDALEKILSADETEMDTLMRKLERDYPAMVAAVFAGEEAEAWLLRLMAAEIVTEYI